jgi:hypothetical protein
MTTSSALMLRRCSRHEAVVHVGGMTPNCARQLLRPSVVAVKRTGGGSLVIHRRA